MKKSIETDERERQWGDLCRKRIESARKSLAKILCRLEGAITDVKSSCELMEWNDDVAYLMEEAAVKLGFSLATLDTWNDVPEDEKD